MKIAIIGAGLAGLTLAKQLETVADVKIFEKSRGVGGRMSTRYAGDYEFDHGAQFFTVTSDRFRESLAGYLADGQVVEWTDRCVYLSSDGEALTPKNEALIYVAAPRMNTLCKAIATGLDIRGKTRVTGLAQTGAGWQVLAEDADPVGPFDWVVSAVPAPQAIPLAPVGFAHMARLEQTEMAGCFTLMVGLEERPDLPWSGAKVDDSPIGWMALNSDKPGRPSGISLLIQSNNAWAEAHLEDDPDAVTATLVSTFDHLTGIDVAEAPHIALHRWRYASVPKAAGQPFLIDHDLKFAACGDWCLRGRVEAAFESAVSLADALRQV
ncbi:MAG: FAD-dependent oxidoreductase [Pseudomonadota bacterium]